MIANMDIAPARDNPCQPTTCQPEQSIDRPQTPRVMPVLVTGIHALPACCEPTQAVDAGAKPRHDVLVPDT
jgi:hypothetical protein